MTVADWVLVVWGVLMLLVIMLTSLPILIPLCLHFARQQSVASP